MISGQLELLQEQDNKSRVFRIEKNRLVKYTLNGRRRNHWKNSYRKRSRFYLKDRCENRRCTTIHNLTIHHKIPLSSAKSEEELIELCNEENCQTLCEKCHEELEHRIKMMRNNKVNKVKLVKSEILSSNSILMLERGLWGEYRIV